MLTYTPRPGSKTEAAVEYLRTHGGRATAIDIAEAVDTERKNLHAIFAAAIGAGLIEGCTLPDGPGYALCGAGREWSAVPVPAASAAASAGSGSTAAAKPTPDTPKRRGRPQGVPKAEKPRRSPPPATPSVEMRCGLFNDGSLRIEAGDTDALVRFFEDGNETTITFTPAAAAALIDYVRRLPS
jgi:hypothetical protein